jgi:hypothetical protein
MSTNNRFKNDTKHFIQQGSRPGTAVTQKEVEASRAPNDVVTISGRRWRRKKSKQNKNCAPIHGQFEKKE